MPDLPPEPVKAADVLAEAIARADGGSEVWDSDDETAASLLAPLSERAGGGGFYVDEDGVLWQAPHKPYDRFGLDDGTVSVDIRAVPAEEPAP